MNKVQIKLSVLILLMMNCHTAAFAAEPGKRPALKKSWEEAVIRRAAPH